MPVTQDTVLSIACDNAACPGTDLPHDDRTGWLFVSAEVYGDPTVQFVYCSPECAGDLGNAMRAIE